MVQHTARKPEAGELMWVKSIPEAEVAHRGELRSSRVGQTVVMLSGLGPSR